MTYISLTQFCEKYGLDRANTWKKIKAGRIPGAVKIGNAWVLPEDTPKPEDGRVRNGNYRGWRKGDRKGTKKSAIQSGSAAKATADRPIN